MLTVVLNEEQMLNFKVSVKSTDSNFFVKKYIRSYFQGHEADHSPPSNAGVKNAWRYTSTPQYAFMAWFSIKHRDNFSFT